MYHVLGLCAPYSIVCQTHANGNSSTIDDDDGDNNNKNKIEEEKCNVPRAEIQN